MLGVERHLPGVDQLAGDVPLPGVGQHGHRHGGDLAGGGALVHGAAGGHRGRGRGLCLVLLLQCLRGLLAGLGQQGVVDCLDH